MYISVAFLAAPQARCLAILNGDVLISNRVNIVGNGALPGEVSGLDGVLSDEIELLQLFCNLFLRKSLQISLSSSSII